MSDEINRVNIRTPFSEILRNHSNGEADDEITGEVTEAVKLLRISGGTAKVTIELTLKSASKDNEAISLTFTKIEMKAPKWARQPQVMFSTADGDLHRNNPRQGDLQLTDVSTRRGNKIIDPMRRALGDTED